MLATVVGDEHRAFADHHVPLDDAGHVLGQGLEDFLGHGGDVY